MLIDFDGPICSVFAGHPAAAIADDLRAIIRRRYSGELPPTLAEPHGDPLRILVQVAALGDEQLTRVVADACRDAEVTAVQSAVPTPGAEDLLRAARESGRRVAIVSNNAGEAIDTYLRRQDLSHCVDGLAARFDGMDPCLLKPHPFLVKRGMTAAGVRRNDVVFVGDSVTDVEAGRAAGIPTVGYANKPGKSRRLADAGADIVIESMHTLAGALLQAARPEQ